MHQSVLTGLREGLEAAVLVGAITAFVSVTGRSDLLRRVRTAVAAAIVVCLGVGIGLHVGSASPPLRELDALDTVIAVAAVATLSYVLMRLRPLGGDDVDPSDGAPRRWGAWALVAMVFLAVVRAGLGSAEHVATAYDRNAEPGTAIGGVPIGLAAAGLLGWAIHRGGVAVLARSLRVAGGAVVVVAAGQVVAALHSAHLADWLHLGQGQPLDLAWLAEAGTLRGAVLRGLLGVEPGPSTIEVIGWVGFLGAGLGLVLWRPGRPFPRESAAATAAATCIAALISVLALVVTEPEPPTAEPMTELSTTAGALRVRTVNETDRTVEVRVSGAALDYRFIAVAASAAESVYRGGRWATAYRSEPLESERSASRWATVRDIVAETGALPTGVSALTDPGAMPVQRALRDIVTVWRDQETGVVLDVAISTVSHQFVRTSGGEVPLTELQATSVSATPLAISDQGSRAARVASRAGRIDEAEQRQRIAAAVAATAALSGLALWVTSRQRPADPPTRSAPARARQLRHP